MQHARQQILEIGDCLHQVKALLPHGRWLTWLADEFAWSEATALRFMRVSTRFKSVIVTDLPIDPSALYILASPSTPDSAVAEALEMAREGEAVSPAKARTLRAQHRGLQEESRPRALPPPPSTDPFDDDEEAIWRAPVAPPPPSPALHFFDDVPMDDFDPTPSTTIAGNPSAWADVIRPPSRWVLVELEPGLPAMEGEGLAAQLRLMRGVVCWAEAFPSSGPLIDALDAREEAP